MADMSYLSGLKAYQSAANAAKASGIGQDIVGSKVEGGLGGEFIGMVEGGLKSSVARIRAGEKTATAAMLGQATLDQLVTAVSDAEMSLRTVVAVRDRIITAYQDIIKMPI